METLKLHIIDCDDFHVNSHAAWKVLYADGIISQVSKPRRAEVLWVRLGHYIDESWMGPHLKCIVSATTGLNHIDLDACERRGITVLSLKGETDFLQEIRATAEHTILLMLALLRNLPSAVDSVKRGEWDRERFKGRELAGKNVAIIGSGGRIGRQVSSLLGHAFGCYAFAIERHHDNIGAWEGYWAQRDMDKIRAADIVTLHANYTPENERMCNAAFFAAMKPGALFINTARGELVDETALLDALRSGHLGGAALDVLAHETQQGGCGYDSPLIEYARKHDNLIITPHLGGCTHESMEKTEEFMAGKLIEWANVCVGALGQPKGCG